MMSIIFLILIICWIFMPVGIYFNDYVFCCLSGMFMMALGVYMIANGLDGINNLATFVLSVIQIGLGGYVFIRKTLEQYEGID